MTEEQTSAPVDILNKMFMVPQDLAELPDPQTVSFMPQTPGWYWLFGFITVVVVALGIHHYLRKRRDLWRHEALELLDNLELTSKAHQLPVLIKRVLLVHVPRSQLSRISGVGWLEQVQQLDVDLGMNQKQIDFLNGPARHLTDIAYRSPHDIPERVMTSLYSLVRQWIKELPHV